MEQLQVFIEAIKDYGAAIISTVSVGGVAAVAGIIAKVKQGIDKTKEQMNALLTKKDEESKAVSTRYNELIRTIESQNSKIDELTQEINKIKK